MSDNTTAHRASEYETEVKRTIPFHDEILATAIHAALAMRDAPPASWLDTGAGPGELVMKARSASPSSRFFVGDPSRAMLDVARARLGLPDDRYFEVGSADLPDIGPLDVVTAIQCHHYGDVAARERAVARCRQLLAPRGVLVVFENVRAETERGHAAQRARWADWLRSRGRDEKAIEKQLAREGTAFFPIRVSEHLALLQKLQFEDVELVWRAYGQAGFVARRPP